MWELTTSTGTTIECCDEHLWNVQDHNDRTRRPDTAHLHHRPTRRTCRVRTPCRLTRWSSTRSQNAHSRLDQPPYRPALHCSGAGYSATDASPARVLHPAPTLKSRSSAPRRPNRNHPHPRSGPGGCADHSPRHTPKPAPTPCSRAPDSRLSAHRHLPIGSSPAPTTAPIAGTASPYSKGLLWTPTAPLPTTSASSTAPTTTTPRPTRRRDHPKPRRLPPPDGTNHSDATQPRLPRSSPLPPPPTHHQSFPVHPGKPT